MEKKYKLTDEYIIFYNRKLYRIEALRDFSNIKKGDRGGFIESEDNLSHNGNCWVYDDAKVYGNAIVYDNATVFRNAIVYEEAVICNNAVVCGNAEIFGNVDIYGNTQVYGNAKVYENSVVCEHAIVCGNAQVRGNTRVYGNTKICGDAVIVSNEDYITFKNWWSSGRYFTWTRSNNMWKVGCFYGTGQQLIEKAYKDSELSGQEYERVVKYVESILKK